MDTLIREDTACAKIEELFRNTPWTGLAGLEEAIRHAIAFRESLPDEDRQMYDEQIFAGIHPAYAANTVRLMQDKART